MTAAEFKRKWSRYQGKETSAYQTHFDDLCRLLGQPTPAEADPSGNDFFCYQKRVVKDAELFDLRGTPDAGEPNERGFADVWKKGCFAWEYKGKKKNLDEAYKQLLRYRESLENPPLLVVCDFDRYIIKTNFNGTVQEVYEFTNAQLDDPKVLNLLRRVFSDPNYLRPQRTTARVTEELAEKIAAVARSLQGRESVELEDAFTRRELQVAQKKNLRIARFLNRIVFCFFAEDTGLLPKKLFSEIAKGGLEDKQHFSESLEQLFRVMSKGGSFGQYKIRHFNGHLFEDVTVFDLTDDEIRLLADAAESDWQFIQPGIMGTLFERALDGEGNLRAQLGAHYTSEADIKTLVEAEIIVGNPPFLGGSKLWEQLGRNYQKELWKIYAGRVPGSADLCCYWFEKSRQQIERGKCKRAGLLATQAIRGGANRDVLKRIKETGDLFFAESDREWVLDGAMVHVSMVGFDNGAEKAKQLDGCAVALINPNLTGNTDVTIASILTANSEICFIGAKKAGQFEISFTEAKILLSQPQNPNGEYNSSVLFPWLNGESIVRRTPDKWIIYFAEMSESESAQYETPFQRVRNLVLPDRRENNEERARRLWWQHRRPAAEMREAVRRLERYIATPRVSKHRIFDWSPVMVLPDDGIYVFARDDDYFFGILHSRQQEIWARSQGTQVRERESGFRYTPTTCFETFPFPFAGDLTEPLENLEAELDAAKHYKHIVLREKPLAYQVSESAMDEHRAAIAAAAKELNEFRENWLNPPEWTVEKILEFPGSVDGPWARYVMKPDKKGIGTVRYPRLEPRDADCAAKLKERTLTKLYNERPAWLDFAHKKLDAAVAAAYGWPADLSDEQILEKLLALNLERAAEEAKAAKVKKPKAQRSKEADELV